MATDRDLGAAQSEKPFDSAGSQQQDSDQGGSVRRQKSRSRASVACSTCRERRIRCVVPAGEAECVQCRRAGQECVIKNDDERRRPISRAYMSTLTDRVSLLESMLKERGTEPPPVVYPSKTTRGSLNADDDASPTRGAAHMASRNEQPTSHAIDQHAHDDTSPHSAPDDGMDDSHIESNASVTSHRNDPEVTHGTPLDDKGQGLVTRLLSTRGHLSFDQISGRLRYYGPTVNSHIYSELGIDDSKSSREVLEQARRAEKIIRTLPLETYDYLMRMFWQHYNSVLHVVHEEAFQEDWEHGRTQFYSGFLHICILAMGFRFADKSRADMQRISLPERESTLHREAKYMLDMELERPGGIPSVAALLILGDSEVGVGRDNVGWMYAGMAMRLAYDIGLHLDSRQAGMPQREIDIRKMTLWACVIYDKYWSLFLGRPTTMKTGDLEIYSLANQFERLGTCKPAGPERSLNTRIYEALIDLMEIAGKIVETPELRRQIDIDHTPDQSAYFQMAAIDRELRTWASRLPSDLLYNEQNRAAAPYSFYLLHQQYHAALILLHRPFARYDDLGAEVEDAGLSALESHFGKASRGICTKSAVAMARIFWAHRQHFDGKQIFCIGMQHAGTAATALIAALAYLPDASDRSNNMQYLEVLHAALQDMTHAYQPAERMAAVLNAVMIELRGGPISPSRSMASATSASIPARRNSTAIDLTDERPVSKRRNTNATSNRPTSIMQTLPTAVMTSSRNHRTSDASFSDPHTIGSFPGLQHHQHQPNHQSNASGSASDFVMVTPRTEASNPWPQLHTTITNESFGDPVLMPTPKSSMHSGDHTAPQMRSTSTQLGGAASTGSTRRDSSAWSTHTQDVGNDLSMPSLAGLQGLAGGDNDMSHLDFFPIPSEADWTRWHAVGSDERQEGGVGMGGLGMEM